MRIVDASPASRSQTGIESGAIAVLAARYRRVRQVTMALIAGLAPEDTVVQSMPDASPAKWHLAHTSWFFEQFVLAGDPGYQPLHADWQMLFNSYYHSVGPMHARPQRGLLTRPGLQQVLEYRAQVDERMQARLHARMDAASVARVVLGLNHEQQHQELLLTDIQHLFSLNPLQPAFARLPVAPPTQAVPLRFIAHPGGIVKIGHAPPDEGDAAFAFDCETPRHGVLLQAHAIASRPVSNAEFRAFIADGGYRTPTLWMAEGWDTVCAQGWQRPLYWADDLDSEFTLGGPRAIDPDAPVVHLSFFEADAFARWAGARLPTEAEWETLAADEPIAGNFLDSGALHPRAAANAQTLQLFGDVWEWTASPYVSYPGFKPLPGALGEYNGKFMCGQWVLRGGSCATPADHIRASYRNFFGPAARWQFSGLRLARDA